ncbi:alpha-amylase family protein [hydrocarbon metagenome]|uniref:Alpha-amylase family protein n=1 Tax=hydrocarbon metagenome TaxID=938273 RepID=A0A0W8FZE5_9ZZZZ
MSLFPPIDVYKGTISVYDYLNNFTEDRPNAEIALEEMFLLYFSDYNPANKKLKELFDTTYFTNKKLFDKAIFRLDEFFKNEKPFGPDNQDIFTLLKTPIDLSPENLEGQLDFVIKKWEIILKDKFTNKVLSSKDLMKEDIRFESFGGGGGGAPTVVPKYKGGMADSDFLMLGKSMYQYAKDVDDFYEEPENFTKDIHWMPNVILMAKNAFVWLDQLSKKYQREIKRLDQVPDEELDQLARWNLNGLWLIGIWERSPASKKIKHIMGNIDAVASAYSLYDYHIAYDLGGDEAYNNLNERAKARGLRLASDMVPNHTGIVSDWVKNRPDYFIQADHPPFPNYTFNGPNLSEDPDYQVRIEDGYYERRDAAVVFQRIDNKTGKVKYIYHGNDGTSMPWNDTAQLNLLNKEVREAVIQKIFDVARKFSIIRFDAAMTLTKKHFQRLWFPQPGTGGDIPSRADHSMTRNEFDQHFPQEFWREVVDRFNKEMPETLLLAEAFWLMEGYFVRSLGMHRVYNSAFMNMMMKEENDKYHDLITNTLEFEPEILKRYVNFMSNPDEETAIKQFGTDDKYFGVLTMMVTLPGLPMFGHGQVEGFTEKYGMEYKRAYYNETPNQWLIDRHQREIFPVMRKRYIFSEVVNFWIFDLNKDNGGVNENVYAFVNSFESEKALVLFNNKFENASGTIFDSAPKLISRNVNKELQTIKIYQALEVKPEANYYYIFRDVVNNLEYIRSGQDIFYTGWRVELGAFKYNVFMNFREVFDDTGEYRKLHQLIGNSGVPNVKRKLDELRYEPIHNALKNIFETEHVKEFIDTNILLKEEIEDRITIVHDFSRLIEEIKTYLQLDFSKEETIKKFETNSVNVRKINILLKSEFSKKNNISYNKFAEAYKLSASSNYNETSLIFLLHSVLYHLKNIFDKDGKITQDNFVNKLLLDLPIHDILSHLGRGEHEIFSEMTLLEIISVVKTKLFDVSDLTKELVISKENKELKEYLRKEKSKEFSKLLKDDFVRTFLGVNFYNDIWYFSKEKFEDLINWLTTVALHKSFYLSEDEKARTIMMKNIFFINNYLKETAKLSSYKLHELEQLINGE